MKPELAVDDLRGYRWMIAAFVAKIRFALNRDLLIRGIRKGKNWFSVFNDNELRRDELERFEDRFANEDHFARFDSFFEFFGNVDLDNLSGQVSWECILCNLARLRLLGSCVVDLFDLLLRLFLSGFERCLELFVFGELQEQLIGVDELLSLLARPKKADLGKGFLERGIELFDLDFLFYQRVRLHENDLVSGA